MSHELDAEDYSELINEYWAICEDVVVDLDGHVKQKLGDGVMAYFGSPRAHEDDPRRAADAALRIVHRLGSLRERLQLELRVTPRVRIGIHTGIAVFSEEGLALGETPIVAARLQQLAEPDAVVVSDAARRLIEGYFHLENLGQQSVKGLAKPIGIYKVGGRTGAQTRVEAVGPQLTPLVGREQEIAALNQAWGSVLAERCARMVVISGEAGIGKSRLVQVLRQRVTESCTVLEGYCSPLHQNTILLPLAQALAAASGLNAVHDGQARLAQLEEYVHARELEPDFTALLAPILALPIPAGSAVATLTPAVKRQRTMQALLGWLRALAKDQPVLFVIEDIHWADPSTLEFLHTYGDSAERAPILVLATCRPEFAPWQSDVLAKIELQRLSQELAAQLVERLAPGETLPLRVRKRVVELTDGVPLYLEEVTKAVVESASLHSANLDRDSVPDSLVPTTVRDSLTARLDRLGDHKSVAQLAAILGREFSHDVLCAIALMDEPQLNAALRHLTESDLLSVDAHDERRTYRFKHALIQESAYQSLRKNLRRQYHHRVASVLLDQFPEVAEAQPGVIAQHYARANLPALASGYFQRAGESAFDAQGYAESISYHRSALAQIEKLAPSKDRDARELRATAALGLPLLMTKGYAAPEVESTYERALSLCAEVDTPLRILFGIWGVQLVRGNRDNAQRMAAQFRVIAETSRSPGERLISWAAVGSHAYWRGEFIEAIPALRSAVAEFEPEMLATLPRDYGYDNALYGHLYLAWALQTAGNLAEANATWDYLWAVTESARAPYLSVLALSFGAAMAHDIGDEEKTRVLSERGIALATEHQLEFFLAVARTQLGSALCMAGNTADGLVLIEQGLGFCRAIGVMTPFTSTLSYLADAHLRAGSVQAGLEVVSEALQLIETHVDRSGWVELLRLKGELVLMGNGDANEAESCLRKALDVARVQGARTGELRASTVLARLMRDRGHRQQAREILEPALSLLNGGEPPILKAAQQLLSEL
jgi:class 3 adenylate cyclase/tetratricopeptide (TPR) repeat protein